MSTARPTDSLVVLLARVFWMMVGPALLFLSTIAILQNPGGWFTSPNLAFLVLLPMTVLARWLEYWGGDPRTATGEAAAPDDLRRYVLFAMPIGLGIWIVANLIGNLLLAK